MRVEIDTSLTQLFAGTRLPTESMCTQCNHTFEDGNHCILYATRPEDAPTYTLTRLYCPNCAPEAIPSPTLGHSEHLLAAHLIVTSDQTDCECQTLSDLQTVHTSAPSEGTANAYDSTITALLPTAALPDLTDTTYHIERDDEEKTPLCNRSPETEFARVALADAETSSARCCRTCLTVHRDEHDTHPWPCCDEQIPLIQEPQHARACTGDPTDAADETDPDGDPAITDTQTQRATSPVTRTSVRVYTCSQSRE